MSVLQLRFSQIDPAAKADINTLYTSGIKPWSVVNDLRYDNINDPGNYMTLEHNYSILDGSMEEFPDSPNVPARTWGFWSDVFSDEDGNFGIYSLPTLDITFNYVHKSIGLTFLFYPHTDDYASKAQVTWFDSSDNIIHSDIYIIDSDIGLIPQSIADFKRIKIEFLSTNIRNRYIKLYAIEFGLIRIFNDAEISTCNILEEIDPTVEEISVNTFNAQIRTRQSIFSPIMSEDFDDMMMRKQPLTVKKDGVNFGIFFLEKWKDLYQSGIAFNLDAGDAISILDLYPFDGGLYNNKSIVELLDEIFNIAFPTQLVKYELDPIYQNSKVTGWIPITNCGTAFQHIMFVIHAIADTSRRSSVWIYEADTEVWLDIDLDEQYKGGSDEPTKYYSGVEVTSYSYSQSGENAQLFNDTLMVGQHKINFKEPMYNINVTGATLIQAHVNYAIINVTFQGVVLITGLKYIANTLTHSVKEEVTAGQVESIKSYNGYTLVNPNIGQALAQKQFDWLQNRIMTRTDIVLDNREVGYLIDVETRGRNLIGTITALDINLRASRANMVVIGNAVNS